MTLEPATRQVEGMMGRDAEASPRLKARIAGVSYLITIVAGFFAEALVRQRLVVPGDAAATTRNILAHELLFRLGFVANVVLLVCNVLLTLMFFELFKVVNRSLAALVAFFILIGTSIEGVNLINHAAPLALLKNEGYSSAFETEQLQSQAYLSLELQSIGFNISLVFFGSYCLLAGYLIFRSTFLPRLLGVLLATGGLCYVTNAFANFLSPEFAAQLLPYILVPCFVAEASLSLWLIFAGVNGPRWYEQALRFAGTQAPRPQAGTR